MIFPLIIRRSVVLAFCRFLSALVQREANIIFRSFSSFHSDATAHFSMLQACIGFWQRGTKQSETSVGRFTFLCYFVFLRKVFVPLRKRAGGLNVNGDCYIQCYIVRTLDRIDAISAFSHLAFARFLLLPPIRIDETTDALMREDYIPRSTMAIVIVKLLHIKNRQSTFHENFAVKPTPLF